MIFTPLGLIVLLLFFDWRLGLLCLVPVGIAFIFMAGMMGDDMKAAMKEYQNSLETLSLIHILLLLFLIRKRIYCFLL